MNKLIVILFSVLSISCLAQDGGVLPTGQFGINSGYIFPSKIEYQQGTLRINGGALFALNGQYIFPSGQGVGAEYTLFPTTIEFDPSESYNNSYSYEKVNLNIHFIDAKGTQFFPVSDVVMPFFDVGMGAAIYAVQDSRIKSHTYFNLNLGAGMEFRVASLISLRLRGGVKMPMYSSGNGFYCGIGGYSGLNCGLSIGGSAIISHWNLGGGLVFNF